MYYLFPNWKQQSDGGLWLTWTFMKICLEISCKRRCVSEALNDGIEEASIAKIQKPCPLIEQNYYTTNQNPQY